MTQPVEDTIAVGASSLWAFFVGLVGAVVVLVWSEAIGYGPERRSEPSDPSLIFAGICAAFSGVAFLVSLAQYVRYRRVPGACVETARAAGLLHGGLVMFYLVYGILVLS